MKKAILSAVAASSLVACTSVESAVVSGAEVSSASGESVAVIQSTSLGLSAIFHIVDLVQSDLDTVVNKLLVAEAKAMGASKVDVKMAFTTPRHGIFALAGGIIGVPVSHAMGIAVK
jgi:hypothetical protein